MTFNKFKKIYDPALFALLQGYGLVTHRQIAVFLFIAEHEPCRASDVMEATGLNRTNVKDIIYVLAHGRPFPSQHGQGKFLVDFYKAEGRAKWLRLNDNGREFHQQLKRYFC